VTCQRRTERRRRNLNAVHTDDVIKLAECCGSVPAAEGIYEYDDLVTNLLLTVLDYQQHTTTVERAMAHYTEHAFERVRTLDDLDALMATTYDDEEGNLALARFLWGYDLWTRAAQLRVLAAFCHEIGATDQEALRAWAASADFSRDFKGRVKGLGIAVFNWLVMRLGVETAKPDVQVRRFVENCLGKRISSDDELVALVVGAAGVLDKPVRELDWAIWEYMRAGGTTAVKESIVEVVAAVTPAGDKVAQSSDEPLRFYKDEAGYAAWLRRHPTGFVVNCDPKPRASYIVAHRSSCSTISGTPARGATFTTPYAKVCSDSLTGLMDWARRVASSDLTRCGRCNP
jgi:hypothetical protein